MTESLRKVDGPWVNDFLKTLEPTAAFAEALREAGLDPDHPADKYPLPAFIYALDLVKAPSGRKVVVSNFK